MDDLFPDDSKGKERVEMSKIIGNQDQRDDNDNESSDDDTLVGDDDDDDDDDDDYSKQEIEKIKIDMKRYSQSILRNVLNDINSKFLNIKVTKQYKIMSLKEEKYERRLVSFTKLIDEELIRREKIISEQKLDKDSYENLLNKSFELGEEIDDELTSDDKEDTKKEEELRIVEDVLENKKGGSQVIDKYNLDERINKVDEDKDFMKLRLKETIEIRFDFTLVNGKASDELLLRTKLRLENYDRIIELTFNDSKVMVFRSENNQIKLLFIKDKKCQNDVERFKDLIYEAKVEYENYTKDETVSNGGVDPKRNSRGVV